MSTKETDVDHLFTYHAPTEETQQRYDHIRRAEQACYVVVMQMTPDPLGNNSFSASSHNAYKTINEVTRNYYVTILAQCPESEDRSAALRFVRLARNAMNEHVTIRHTRLAEQATDYLTAARWLACGSVALHKEGEPYVITYAAIPAPADDKKTARQRERAKAAAAIREILRVSWDPLKVCPGQPNGAPADEYDTYADAVTAMLAAGAPPGTVAYFLADTARAQMEVVSALPMSVAAQCWAAYQGVRDLIEKQVNAAIPAPAGTGSDEHPKMLADLNSRVKLYETQLTRLDNFLKAHIDPSWAVWTAGAKGDKPRAEFLIDAVERLLTRYFDHMHAAREERAVSSESSGGWRDEDYPGQHDEDVTPEVLDPKGRR